MITDDRESGKRDFKITKTLLNKFGTTADCPGCFSGQIGLRRGHSAECRNRMEQCMRDSDQAQYGERIKQRNVRMGIEVEVKSVEDNEAIVMQEDQVDEDSEEEKEIEDELNPHEEPVGESPRNGGLRDRDRSNSFIHDEDEAPLKRQRLRALNNRNNARRICNITNSRSEFKNVNRMLSDLEGDGIDHLCGEKNNDHIDCTKIMNALMMMEVDKKTRHPHDDTIDTWWDDLHRGVDFSDDVNDHKSLSHQLVVKARRLEIDYFKKMRVYDKVHKSEAKGCKIITTRWIDTNKGDDVTPDHRSRMVGREIKTDNRLDLFAATPPLGNNKGISLTLCQWSKSKKAT